MIATTTETDLPAARAQGSTVPERALLVAAVVATALIAGFFYAFACSVMLGLARTDDLVFITTMQAINDTVRNAAFAPSFFGALVLPLLAALVGHRRGSPARWWSTAGLVLYAAAFAVTMLISVPMNEALAAAGPPDQIADPAAVRRAYEAPWVSWNLVRTGLSIAALLALLRALLLRSTR